MLRWYSPFQLPPEVTAALLEFGAETWDPGFASPATSASCRLLIYVPPHLGLVKPASLIKRYQDLLTLEPEGLLIHCERVSAFLHQRKQTAEISADVIWKGKDDNHPEGSSREFHRFKVIHQQPDPLTALVTLALIRELPAVLDAYLDLELASELVGDTPDSHYLEALEPITVTEKLLNFIASNPSQDDLKQAQAQINSLEDSLQNQKVESHNLKKELKDQIAITNGKEDNLKQAEAKINSLEANLKIQKQENQNLNKELKDQIDITTNQEQESKKRNHLLQSSQAEIKAKAFEIAQLNSQVEYLSSSVEEHRQQNTLLVEQLQASCEQLELYYSASTKLKQELENWRSINQTTQQQHLELTNQFHQLNRHNQEQLEAHQQEILTRDAEIQKRNNDINELRTQVSTLNTAAIKHQEEIHALISQLQHSCEKLEHYDSLTQNMKQQIQDLHVSREESQQSHQALLDQFQVTLTLNEQKNLEQSQEIQLLNQQLESLRAVNDVQRDEHLSKIADWQQSCSERDQQLLARDNEIQRIDLELKAKAGEIFTLTAQVSNLQDCLREDRRQHEVTLAHWSQTVEQQKSQLTAMTQELQTKELEFQQKSEEINHLKGTTISLRRTIEQQRNQQSALLQQLQSSCETLELYHIDGKNGRRLVEAQARELQRASHLLQRVSLLKGISNKSLPASSKQLLALLEGYRHNLKRAESLLAKGGAGNDD